MKNQNYDTYMNLPPCELLNLAKRRGWLMSSVGFLVYSVLKLFGVQPKSHKGICEYFEIGNSWGGVSLGYFFICDKTCQDATKNHEVGHCVQNAAVGGLKMGLYSIASAARYCWRAIFKPKTSYYAWFFERDASRIGADYVAKWETF